LRPSNSREGALVAYQQQIEEQKQIADDAAMAQVLSTQIEPKKQMVYSLVEAEKKCSVLQDSEGRGMYFVGSAKDERDRSARAPWVHTRAAPKDGLFS
jgi:hypothetical protein